VITKMLWRAIMTYAVTRGVYRGVRQSIQEARAVETVGRAYHDGIKEVTRCDR
jgi:hypothetical protein